MRITVGSVVGVRRAMRHDSPDGLLSSYTTGLCHASDRMIHIYARTDRRSASGAEAVHPISPSTIRQAVHSLRWQLFCAASTRCWRRCSHMLMITN
jgi:hypothetical protein